MHYKLQIKKYIGFTLTRSSRIRIEDILTRLSKENEVSLEERIYINKYASRNKNVSAWLTKESILKGNR